jgi:hypothetical protein
MVSVSAQDLFALVGTICIVWVTIFLCWALYQIGRLISQANSMVADTREKISRFERAIMALNEKLGSASQYLAFIAEGGKQLLSYLGDRKKKKGKKGEE